MESRWSLQEAVLGNRMFEEILRITAEEHTFMYSHAFIYLLNRKVLQVSLDRQDLSEHRRITRHKHTHREIRKKGVGKAGVKRA